MTTERPKSVGNESTSESSLVVGGENASLPSLGLRLEMLVGLLLVVGHHLENENRYEDRGEPVIKDVETGVAERGGEGGGEREEEVLGKFGGGEEHVLDDGDKSEIHCTRKCLG